MHFEFLADLDELILKCRNVGSKEYLAEAVACYKAGAYRSCIVATWIALVFDFINKLKELELAGDKNAKLKLEEFSRLCNQSDFRGSLNFEQSFLEFAKKDFELLTPIEFEDLSRLHEDRNRCAHPSMQSIDEPYTPTAELARYHLRNAVVHFIGRPPVQGKAALDRIWSEIKSEYFPTDWELALKHFQEGPLARAKDSLIRSTVIGLTKDLFQQNRKEQERTRQFSALQAIYKMYSFQTDRYIKECLPDIIRLTEDPEWNKVIEYIKHLPISWELMGSAAQIKAYEYIRNIELIELKEVKVISDAIKIRELREEAITNLPKLPLNLLRRFVTDNPIVEVADIAINQLKKSRSFAGAYTNFFELITPLTPLFTGMQVKEIIEAYYTNDQIYKSGGIEELYTPFFNETIRYAEENKAEWTKLLLHMRRWGPEDSELEKAIIVKFPELNQ